MECVAEMLLWVARVTPQQLDGEPMEGVVMFLIAFLASDSHIRNPYLRSKLAEVPLPCCSCMRSCCTLPGRSCAAARSIVQAEQPVQYATARTTGAVLPAPD